MTKKDFNLKEEYIKWLKKNGVAENSIQSYCPSDKCLSDEYKGKLFLNIIGDYAKNGDLLGASAYIEEWKSYIYKLEIIPKTRSNRLDYLLKYKSFILEYLEKNKKKSNKGIQDRPFFDGMDSLISSIGAEKFIKMAIQGSYIFSKELEETRLV